MSTTLELRNIAQGNQHRTADVRLYDNGALVVEGCDVGPELSEYFGMTVSRYEWGVRVPPDQVPALLEALGRPGDEDPVRAVEAVADWFTGETRAFEPYLDAHGVVHESWSRVRD